MYNYIDIFHTHIRYYETIKIKINTMYADDLPHYVSEFGRMRNIMHELLQ
jgi:hypothetical protein